MQTEVTTGQGLNRSISVTVPAAEVAKHMENRINAMTSTVKIAGFRPGKVPAKVVKERMGDQIASDVAQSLVQQFLPKALDENKLSIAGQPRVHAGNPEEGFKAAEGQDFTFTAEFEIYPDVTAKGYTGLKLTKETAEPSDELVQSALKRLEGQMATYAPKEKGAKAAQGDQLTVTGQGYTVKADGSEEAFAGGNLKDFRIVLGSGQLIPGFEDALVGAKVGDEVDVKVTFPADYHAKELASQPAVFKLKIDEISAPKEEALSDDSVKQLGFETLDALKDILKKGAVRDLTMATEQRLKRQLLDALEEANKDFDLPQGLVNSEHQALWRAQLQELQQRRLPIEALGNSVEEAIASLKPLAERRVRLGLVMASIAKQEKIEVNAADLEAAVNAQIAAAGPQADQARKYFANPANRQQLSGPVLEDKVTGWLIEKADVTTKEIPSTELLTELQ
ncbi:MAG: trigger factor [Blastochloris viridis]|uniref:Trigger factor n=1 Tax=Blastochloris viridis TaxID=1079 RepID=A0A6N4R5M0_BLAVI|nr:MAG: trigger factor [Blastochloris viridis]